MAPPTTIKPGPIPNKNRTALPVPWWWVAAAAGAVLIAISIGAQLRGPTFANVALANHTDYTLQVDVAGLPQDGWTSLGYVRKQTTEDFSGVADQGNTWIFHFTAAGEDGGQVTITKAELKRSHWRLDIPNDVAVRLRAAGVTPSSS